MRDCSAFQGGNMAYEPKTKLGTADIEPFLAAVEPAVRQADARRLVEIFRQETLYAPRLWGPTMIGFGSYRYTYATGHTGEAMATGFAPRKAELVLYVCSQDPVHAALLGRLGKHRQSRACTYVRKLSDIDETVLRELIRAGLAELKTRWPVTPN